MSWYNTISGDPNEFHTDTRVPAVGSPVTAQSVEYSTQDLLDNTANLKATKAELDGGNTFTGTQVFTDPAQFPGGIVADQVEFTTPRTRQVTVSAMDFRVYHQQASTPSDIGVSYPSTVNTTNNPTIRITKLGNSVGVIYLVGSVMIPGNYEIDLYETRARFRTQAGRTWGYQAEIFTDGVSRKITNPVHDNTVGVDGVYDLRVWDGGASGDRYINSDNLPSMKLVVGLTVASNSSSPNNTTLDFEKLVVTVSLRGGMIRGA